MIQATPDRMIDFRPLTVEDKALYDAYLAQEKERGCEFSFANLFLWGRQRMALLHGHIVLFSQFDRRSVYPWPLGEGDKRPVLDAIMADARARGIPCRLTGLGSSAKATLESLYPGRFRFHCDEGSFDYVYDVDDLADLKGKKYHGKRNHLNRFSEQAPHAVALPLDEETLPAARRLIDAWYEEKWRENPNGDYHMERAALDRALRYREALALEGLVLMDGEEALAVTLGSHMAEDTVDVHFEKASSDVQGAYTAINRAFARYIRDKYPTVRFLDREEDMGLEGLRRAKKSYYPHHMIEKCWACLLEDGYDY